MILCTLNWICNLYLKTVLLKLCRAFVVHTGKKKTKL